MRSRYAMRSLPKSFLNANTSRLRTLRLTDKQIAQFAAFIRNVNPQHLGDPIDAVILENTLGFRAFIVNERVGTRRPNWVLYFACPLRETLRKHIEWISEANNYMRPRVEREREIVKEKAQFSGKIRSGIHSRETQSTYYDPETGEDLETIISRSSSFEAIQSGSYGGVGTKKKPRKAQISDEARKSVRELVAVHADAKDKWKSVEDDYNDQWKVKYQVQGWPVLKGSRLKKMASMKGAGS